MTQKNQNPKRKKISLFSLSSSGKTTLARILTDLNPKAQLVDLDPKGHLRLEEKYFSRAPFSRGYLDVWAEIVVYDHPTFIDTANRVLLKEASHILVPLFPSPRSLFDFSRVFVELEDEKLLGKTQVVFNGLAPDIPKKYLEDFLESFKSIYPKIDVMTGMIPFAADFGFISWQPLPKKPSLLMKEMFGSLLEIT